MYSEQTNNVTAHYEGLWSLPISVHSTVMICITFVAEIECRVGNKINVDYIYCSDDNCTRHTAIWNCLSIVEMAVTRGGGFPPLSF